jgi:hypothetical protein
MVQPVFAPECTMAEDVTKTAPPQVQVSFANEVNRDQAESDIIAPRAYQLEDEFSPFYGEGGLGKAGLSLIAPPYPLATLERICQENSAIGPCIDAMETNADATGWVIEPRDEKVDAANDPTVKLLTDFFNEVWPGVSFRRCKTPACWHRQAVARAGRGRRTGRAAARAPRGGSQGA